MVLIQLYKAETKCKLNYTTKLYFRSAWSQIKYNEELHNGKLLENFSIIHNLKYFIRWIFFFRWCCRWFYCLVQLLVKPLNHSRAQTTIMASTSYQNVVTLAAGLCVFLPPISKCNHIYFIFLLLARTMSAIKESHTSL